MRLPQHKKAYDEETPIGEALINALEELKRADHQVYVSLKYTRTVDVIKNILNRFINATKSAIDAYLLYAIEKKKLGEMPGSVMECISTFRSLASERPELVSFINLYIYMRNMNRSEYERFGEFRRNVTMRITLDGATHDLTIDAMYELNRRTIAFVTAIRDIILSGEKP
ncbi:hypothetical protein J4460_06990 [Candidatus Woesearchaeota archaeon]|nr:MAG: hypothetical protein QS99_C0018G0048 [archaeon GW2011_AR4]MBS3130385.1 hypothetical protein [Candidatus Woesearchaeota archaeon]HIH38250.1 hypothetical protein [Candidatus Woesearchaeota archaeon]HIH49097.1 hypothetical protein [Candidatus Woesearchaeota archaeon]HIJ04164.1 hypothetical protein [Candidatus Woesearchaeota archaeon]